MHNAVFGTVNWTLGVAVWKPQCGSHGLPHKLNPNLCLFSSCFSLQSHYPSASITKHCHTDMKSITWKGFLFLLLLLLGSNMKPGKTEVVEFAYCLDSYFNIQTYDRIGLWVAYERSVRASFSKWAMKGSSQPHWWNIPGRQAEDLGFFFFFLHLSPPLTFQAQAWLPMLFCVTIPKELFLNVFETLVLSPICAFLNSHSHCPAEFMF